MPAGDRRARPLRRRPAGLRPRARGLDRDARPVAVNFDAPSARAPQAILLCSVPTEDGWDFDAVVDLLDQSLDLAQVRMVGPETLDGLGQYLPATYLHFDTESGGTA